MHVAGATPLHLGCWMGSASGVQVLLEHSAGPNIKESDINCSHKLLINSDCLVDPSNSLTTKFC